MEEFLKKFYLEREQHNLCIDLYLDDGNDSMRLYFRVPFGELADFLMDGFEVEFDTPLAKYLEGFVTGGREVDSFSQFEPFEETDDFEEEIHTFVPMEGIPPYDLIIDLLHDLRKRKTVWSSDLDEENDEHGEGMWSYLSYHGILWSHYRFTFETAIDAIKAGDISKIKESTEPVVMRRVLEHWRASHDNMLCKAAEIVYEFYDQKTDFDCVYVEVFFYAVMQKAYEVIFENKKRKSEDSEEDENKKQKV